MGLLMWEIWQIAETQSKQKPHINRVFGPWSTQSGRTTNCWIVYFCRVWISHCNCLFLFLLNIQDHIYNRLEIPPLGRLLAKVFLRNSFKFLYWTHTHTHKQTHTYTDTHTHICSNHWLCYMITFLLKKNNSLDILLVWIQPCIFLSTNLPTI